MEMQDLVLELRQFRRWVALGSVGALLVGVASMSTIYTYQRILDQAKTAADCKKPPAEAPKRHEPDFGDTASELFETGKLTELAAALEKRKAERPNDGEVYWWYARLHVAEHNFSAAKMDLNLARINAPGWNEEYVEPMLKAINELEAKN